MIFHAAGYGGGGANLAENFAQGRTVGVPMLAWYGMTCTRGESAFPKMTRWLR